ncbi:MAG: ribulose-phosphate 3-epimerase [Bdellovibrionales bacterium]|nr:ribulose-phosphate 3-epimerase [Bdellovibrionales bacterium]
MKKPYLVAPSILSADFSRLGEEVKAVETAGADRLHVDVMDGHFVPNLTIGRPIIDSLSKVSSLPLDIHLMVNEPARMISYFFSSGIDSITIHLEAVEESHKDRTVKNLLETIQKNNILAGLALKPKTPVEKIFPLLSYIDLVLIMTVEPGFGGQSLIPQSVSKISIIKEKLRKQGLDNVLVHVDGGVNDKTVSLLSSADVLISGHFIFKHNNYKEAISILKTGSI